MPVPSKFRLGLLGPVLPFRSGIAQHTTRLQRALRARADLTVLSFSRQYPAWLYPGASDRDPFHEGHREPGVEYVVDALNPWTWRRAVGRFVDARVAAVVLPWWTVFFAPLAGYLARALRARGIRVVFLCHNVTDHEAARYKVELSRRVLRGAQGYCVQSVSEAANLSALLPGARVVVHSHPLYDHYPAADRILPRRAPLELLFFGVVRPYKGLDVLLEAMALIQRRDVRLTVVGEFWEDLAATLTKIADLGTADRIEVVPRYVSEQEAANYFARADLIVLPYRSASGTGIIPMAYHYDKPVLATRVGGLVDAVEPGKTGWLVEPESPRALSQAIDEISPAALDHMHPDIRRFKAGMTWESLADTLLELSGWNGASRDVRVSSTDEALET